MNDPGVDLVLLAVLMGLVTYPARSVPLLAAHVGRLPPMALAYLRLVGPAVLAALAAVNALVVVRTTDAGARDPELRLGIEVVAVVVCAALVAWRRNLLLGIVVAVGGVAVVRWVAGG